MNQRVSRLDPYRLTGALFGQYEIVELVGMGGMGAVYRARHCLLEDFVALKILKPDLTNESAKTKKKLEELFLQEAKNTRRLQHPYIVRVIDVAISNQIPHLLMEWLEGHTLDKELEQQTIPVERSVLFLEQICEGMAHAHDQGIVHLDLKPANIMIVKDSTGLETVRILDFGIAKALNSINTRVIGAPHYASPEQLDVGSFVDQRSDVYSLGVMSYEMLTGRLPFTADSIGKIVNQHLKAPPPLLREIRPEISEALEGVVLKALAKSPADRYQSVLELARAFASAAELKTGVLSVHCVDAATGSNLPGVSIYVNGKRVGTTKEDGKWQRNNLVPREYSLHFEHHQYQGLNRRVTVASQTEVKVELVVRELGHLSVRTIEAGSGVPLAGAQVVMNGKLLGTTSQIGLLHEADLTTGKFEVEVGHSDRRFTFNREVEIVGGQECHLDVEFPEEIGRSWRVPIPKLRLIIVSAALVLLVTAVSFIYKFNSQSAEIDQFLNTISQAGLYNDKGIRSHEIASNLSLDSLSENPQAELKSVITKLYGSAALNLQQAVDFDCRRDNYQYNLGHTLLFLNEFQKAQRAFNSAKELNPENTEYRLASEALGRMILNWQQPASAGPAYTYANALNVSLFYFERGNIFLDRKEYECAEFEYRQASELDRHNPEIFYMRGESLRLQLNYNDAKPIYEQAWKLDPTANRYITQKAQFSQPGVTRSEPEASKFRRYKTQSCQ